MEKKLGKIENVCVGIRDGALGIHFTLSSSEWGVGDSRLAWDPETVKVTEYTKWSEKDRDEDLIRIMRFISKLLKEAKVDSVDKLKDKPVEVIFENNMLVDWRILTEVI